MPTSSSPARPANPIVVIPARMASTAAYWLVVGAHMMAYW